MNLSEKVVIRPYDENQGGDLLRDQVERLIIPHMLHYSMYQ